MGVRRWLYRQLEVTAWERHGMSPLNGCVVGLILLNLVLQVLATERVVVASAGGALAQIDRVVVAIFTVEYALRVWVAGEDPRYRGLRGRLRYMMRFFSLIDLAAILPAYVTLGTFSASGLRALRLLRVLRFARLGGLTAAFTTLIEVFRSRAHELSVALLMTLGLLLMASTAMYFVEGPAQPEQFGSIPRALWWSVVTMTTVGYGDSYPITPLGKVLAGFVQIASLAVVAVPTGITAAAFVEAMDKRRAARHKPGP